MKNINNKYEIRKPDKQNIFDIFKDEFKTKLPIESNLITYPGDFEGFADERVNWTIQQLDDINNKLVLDLGPFELGAAYMFNNAGANVISIESNSLCYLKSLCVKDCFKLNNVELLYGDFNEYLKDNTIKFDLIFASGVLYHMLNPVETIKLISNATDKVFIWTHYYTENNIIQNLQIDSYEYESKIYNGAKQLYGEIVDTKMYCG